MNNDSGAGRGDSTLDGELAVDFLSQVGAAVRTLRTQQSLTVQQLADRSSISRRLMTQIELGQANPSLITVTRIARQLGAEFTDLLGTTAVEAPITTHGVGDHVLVWSSGAGSTAHLLESTTGSRAADLWLWRLLPGDIYRGRPDPERSRELFYVVSGSLTIGADDVDVAVAAGGSCRLCSDRPYLYRNDGTVPVEFVRTVSLGP